MSRARIRAYARMPDVTRTDRPFVAPPCAHCGERLADPYGNPRWEIAGILTFVCLGGCPAERKEAAR